ncbi:hypothetical protein Lser_V15G19914 [Lactuca serriola]
MGHPTNMCPILQEDAEHVNATGEFQNYHNKPSGYQNAYNSSWKPNPNTSYNPRPLPQNALVRPSYPPPQPHYQHPQPHYQSKPHPPHHQQPPQSQPGSSGMSLEDIVKSLATSAQQFQKETRTSISNLEAQMGDIVTSISKLESRGKFPSQTEKNPNVNVVTLRSGKQAGEISSKKKPMDEEEEIKVIPVEEPMVNNDAQARVPKKTIPLELCTNKRKLKGNEKISMNENASAVLQRKLSPKCKDPGMFTVIFKIGDVTFSSSILDLGASINAMPYLVYESLNVGPLSETGVIISLTDKSSVFPRCVLEDVLVQVNQLVFPTDFYVIDLDEQVSSKSGIILLGRPFLKTTRTKIDVYAGSFTMEFDGETISFNIYDAMRYPSDVSSLCFVDVVEPLTQELFELSNGDMLEMVLSKGFDCEKLAKKLKLYSLDPLVNNLEIKKTTQFSVKQIELPQTHTRLPPSLIQTP